MKLWHEMDPGPSMPDVIYVVVEIPKGSRNKYEFDKKTGAFKLDRVLYSPVHYPGDYGFIPQTHYDDNDPFDVLVMTNLPTFPGCILEARPVGMFRMTDRGEADDKILAVLHHDPFFAEIEDYTDLPAHYLKEVEQFFRVYKDLEAVRVKPIGWENALKAKDRIRYAVGLYRRREPSRPDLTGVKEDERRRAMPTYVSLLNWTDQGIRKVKETAKRAEAFQALA